jgi:non-specific serine/threonine protein kinase
MQGDIRAARTLYRESLLTARDTGNRRHLAFTLSAVATLAIEEGPERALRLDAAGRAAAGAMGAVLVAPVRQLWEGQLDQARHALGPERAIVAAAMGEVLTLEEAVDEALAWLSAPDASPSRDQYVSRSAGAARSRVGGPKQNAIRAIGIEALTCREREVAALIADGATNRQIAEALVISPHTAERHVEHILAKLDCTSRAEVAAWVARQGLVVAPTSSNAA